MTTTWNDDAIQFPRLLAEIRAVGLSLQQYEALTDSMDLGFDEINEVLERAESAWERIKDHTDADGYHGYAGAEATLDQIVAAEREQFPERFDAQGNYIEED